MDIHTATEVAYKNGYEAGAKELAERLIEKAYVNSYSDMVVNVASIDHILKEMVGENK